jgi:hypothetical protein
MTSLSTADLRVVHVLRVRGFVDTPLVAEVAGMSVDEATSVLTALEAAGHARHREGRMSGWMLTSDGRAHGEVLLAEELAGLGCRAEVEGAYSRFLEGNQGFLGLCTDWQLRPDPGDLSGEPVMNDHADPAYDEAVIGRLAETDSAIQPVCAALAALLERFGGYGERFATALARVTGGDLDWFTKPMIESYHTVWFELHENLLATLGIQRSKEHASG